MTQNNLIDVDEILGLEDHELIDRDGEANERIKRFLNEKLPVITVDGNIGFGKTRIAKTIAKHGAVISLEDDTDPVLTQLYYEVGRDVFGTILQAYLLAKRAAQSWDGFLEVVSGRPFCTDRSPYGELMFIDALNKIEDENGKKNIEDEAAAGLYKAFELVFSRGKEYKNALLDYKSDLLDSTHVARSKLLNFKQKGGSPPPDILVLLHGDRQVAWNRLSVRGRDYEGSGDSTQGLPEELHIALHCAYDNFEEIVRTKGLYEGPIIYLEQPKVNLATKKGELVLLESLLALEDRLDNRNGL